MLESLPRQHWLDVGTGAGGFLHALRELVGDQHHIEAVEVQAAARRALQQEGWQTAADLNEVATGSIDFLSAWHVFEHLSQPLEFMHACARVLRPGGKMCLEVPHARDALLSQYQSNEFCDFTLWSEHLLLHTRESLTAFATAAGFKG